MAKLVCEHGELEGQVFTIDKGLTLGRERHNSISLPKNRKWSRDHAKVWQVGVNAYAVADLGSTNGTLVNNQKVTRAELKEGDNIQLGDVVFRFELDEAEKPKPKIREPDEEREDLASLLRGETTRDKPLAASLEGHAAIQVKERILQYSKKKGGDNQLSWDISQMAGVQRLLIVVVALAVFVGLFVVIKNLVGGG